MQKFYQKMTYKNNLKYIVVDNEGASITKVNGQNDEEAKTP